MGKTADYAATRLPHKERSLAAAPLLAAFTPQTCPPCLESGISGIILLSDLTLHTSIFGVMVRQFDGLDPTSPSSAKRRLKSGSALQACWVKLVMTWRVLHLSSQPSEQLVPVCSAYRRVVINRRT